MAETLVGAKSKLYIKEEIPGIKESGDTLQHVTAQEIAGNRVGLDTVIHGVYKTHVPPKLIEVGSVKRLIKITAHGARKGDILKINNGAAVGEEVAIVKVEDADTLVIATEINAAIGDEVFIMRHVTPLYDEDGNLNVNATPGPSQFVRNGIDVEVEEDTVTMANNKPMPGGMYIKKDDGSWYPVTLDTTNPYAHTPIPVAITDVTGTSNVNVDLSGSSLSVNIKHDGVSPSSIRIGDGTTLTSVTVNNELKVKDTDVETVIGAVDTVAPLTDIASSNINGRLQRVAQNITSLSNQLPAALGSQVIADSLSVNIASDQIVETDLPDAVKLDIQEIGDYLGNIDSAAPALDTDNATINGRLKGVMVRLSSLISKLPVTLGTQTTANSLAVNIASDQVVSVSLPVAINTDIANIDDNTKNTSDRLGDLNESEPVDELTASGLNGRLKRIASRLTLLISKLPATLGQKTMANSLSVTLATDQGALSVTPTNNSGTITNAQVTVGTSAVRATVSGSAPNAARKKLIIKSSKNNTGSIYLGSSSITTANGLEIIGPDRLEFELDASDYYLISDTAAQVVEVLEVV